MAPELFIVVVPLGKVNSVPLGFAAGLNAGTVRVLGVTPGGTIAPVPEVAVTGPATVAGVAVTGPATVAGVGVTLATAGAVVPGLRVALVKNGTALIVAPFNALAIVGVMPVTTVVPGVPVTPLITSTKVGVTLVTHVAAEAEDNSPALRPPTVSAPRSV